MFGRKKNTKSGIAATRAALGLRWQAEIDDHVIALAWAPDGSALAAAAVGGPVTVLDGTTGRVRCRLAGHGFGTTALSWNGKSGALASSGQDGTVKVWDLATAKPALTLQGGAAWVERVAWSPGGAWLAAAAGKKVRLWDPAGKLVRDYGDHPSTVADIQWKPDASELTTAAYGQLAFFAADRQEPVRVLKWQGSQLVLAWSPDGKHLATGDQDATVHFWIIKTGEDLMMSGYPTKVRELAWDPTSRYLATGGGSVPCVWDVSGKGPAGTTPLQLAGHKAAVTALAYQHAGPRLASASADGMLMLWHPGKLTRPLARTELPAGITQLTWSADDQRLAAGTESGRIAVWSFV